MRFGIKFQIMVEHNCAVQAIFTRARWSIYGVFFVETFSGFLSLPSMYNYIRKLKIIISGCATTSHQVHAKDMRAWKATGL